MDLESVTNEVRRLKADLERYRPVLDALKAEFDKSGSTLRWVLEKGGGDDSPENPTVP